MASGFVYLRPARLVCVRVHGPYETSVGEAWRKLNAWLARHGAERELRIGYGLARDDPKLVAPEQCRFDACIEMPYGLEGTATDEVMTQKLPGGAYARHRHIGALDTIAETFTTLRAEWSGADNITLDLRRPLVTIYLTHPLKAGSGPVRCDLCTPVHSAAERKGIATKKVATAA